MGGVFVERRPWYDALQTDQMQVDRYQANQQQSAREQGLTA